jgi:hypothetical protein
MNPALLSTLLHPEFPLSRNQVLVGSLLARNFQDGDSGVCMANGSWNGVGHGAHSKSEVVGRLNPLQPDFERGKTGTQAALHFFEGRVKGWER